MLRKRRNPAPIEWGVVCAAKRETQAANQSVENPIEIDNLLLSIVGRGGGKNWLASRVRNFATSFGRFASYREFFFWDMNFDEIRRGGEICPIEKF